jgi:hypothetical protein
MSAESAAQTTPSITKTSSRKTWIYVFCAILVLVGLVYYSLLNRSSSYINNDFYRVLYEASNRFNENLNSLNSMHESLESEVAIRALVPSYRRSNKTQGYSADETKHTDILVDSENTEQNKGQQINIKTKDFIANIDLSVSPQGNSNEQSTETITQSKKELVSATAKPEEQYQYRLVGQKINITANSFTAILDLNDLLPSTKAGFSQFLFAKDDGSVIASTGGEKTISIVEMKSISQQLLKQTNQYWLNLSSKSSDEPDPNISLPSYSSHVDMKLSYGEFRIFIFPFTLSTPLFIDGQEQSKQNTTRLFLVGLLPQNELQSKGSGKWNISLLVVTLVSLIFMWALLRLILLPENHSITRFYRTLSQLSSYAFYIVLVALILSYLSKSGLQTFKNKAADDYARQISNDLTKELFQVFNELNSYRNFYVSIISGLKSIEPIKDETTQNNLIDENGWYTWPTEEIRSTYTSALAALAARQFDICPDCGPQKPLPSLMASEKWDTAVSNQYDTQGWTSDFKAKTTSDSAIETRQTFSKDKDEIALVNFYAGELIGDIKNNNQSTNKERIFNTYINNLNEKYQAPKVLSIFAMNEKGNANLPSIYFQEANSKPQAFSLSHREYFKKVRDFRGWYLHFNEAEANYPNANGPLPKFIYSNENIEKTLVRNDFKNVYIQRLLNLNDGTRGTTISIPMYSRSGNSQHNDNGNQNNGELKAKQDEQHKDIEGYVMGADIILPSLSLAPPAKFDFIFMVVDRNTGEVLFHSDEDRSLVENVFYAGQSKSNLTQWIKAGLDQNVQTGDNHIDGFYHGEEGVFTLVPTKIDAWSLVIFSPNDSLDSFMTNQFMYIVVTFMVLLGLLLLAIKIGDNLISTAWLKQTLGLVPQLDTKRFLLICTALFTTNYCLFYICALLFPNATNNLWNSILSGLFSAIGTCLLLFTIYRYYVHHFNLSIQKTDSEPERLKIHKLCQGAKAFIVALALVALMHFIYLRYSAFMPLKSLQQYYKQQQCNGINKEKTELTNMALKRYPNSVTQHRISPFELLPLEHDWQQQLLSLTNSQPANEGSKGYSTACKNQLSSIEPEDYPKLSTLVGSTFVWKWINNYLLDSSFYPEQDNINLKSEPSLIAGSVFTLFFLIWLWFYFNRRILWPRIYCPTGFLRHIIKLCEFASQSVHEQPSKKLIICIDAVKLSGVGLALLLRNQQIVEGKKNTLLNVTDAEASDKSTENAIEPQDSSQPTTELMTGFDRLYQLSPCLQQFGRDNTFLPNLKIKVKPVDHSNKVGVEIWDIETCIENPKFRQHLLDLIMELKSLTLADKIESFTIFSGFRSLRRVKMKDSLAGTTGSLLEQTEYLSWSECLMDFSVKVSKVLFENIDPVILCSEVAELPELAFLRNKLPKSCRQISIDKAADETHFWRQRHHIISKREWATIHYILLHADALYRFKWESCSSGEKLALYNLAKQHRLNPSNTEMIEHLAVNGMLKVNKDQLELINKSFTHFVLHAETANTLDKLVQDGEAGVWKSYRLPLGILIVLVIGGIALTSGQSIFIIAASLAGVLGTIGSLTSSASMLKGQFRD